jgi:hypothetical protein
MDAKEKASKVEMRSGVELVDWVRLREYLFVSISYYTSVAQSVLSERY